MGGRGSGRRRKFGSWDTEDFRSLDVRWLKREGLLEPGRIAQVTWSRRERMTGKIGIIAERSRIILHYRQRPRGGEWEALSYSVDLVETPCNLGGARPWFLCPDPGCRRRVAILYADRLFVCPAPASIIGRTATPSSGVRGT